MLELWQFIFSSFWIWLGTVILIGTLGSVTGGLIAALKRRED